MHNTKYFEPNRRATWLELFFDLIFVVAIGDVTHILNHTHEGHLDPLRFWQYVLTFIPLWWIWVSHTRAADISPLYCWYNYFHWEAPPGHDTYGCAIADAYSVFLSHLPKGTPWEVVKDFSFAWHEMVCSFDHGGGTREVFNYVTARAQRNAVKVAPLLPPGVAQMSPVFHAQGLPRRVVDMLRSKGSGTKVQKRDDPVVLPKRLIVIKDRWQRSSRFD